MEKISTDLKIIGQKCWRAWEGVLPAIFFELGKKIGDKKGEISLCFDTLPWELMINDRLEVDSKSDKKRIIDALFKINGQIVTNFYINKNDQTVELSFNKIKIIGYFNNNNDSFYIINSNEEELAFNKKNL